MSEEKRLKSWLDEGGAYMLFWCACVCMCVQNDLQ